MGRKSRHQGAHEHVAAQVGALLVLALRTTAQGEKAAHLLPYARLRQGLRGARGQFGRIDALGLGLKLGGILLHHERGRNLRGVVRDVFAQSRGHHGQVQVARHGETLRAELAHALGVRLLAEPSLAGGDSGAHAGRILRGDVGHEHGDKVGLEGRGVHFHVCQPVVAQVAFGAPTVEKHLAARGELVELALEGKQVVLFLLQHLDPGQVEPGDVLGKLTCRVVPHHNLGQLTGSLGGVGLKEGGNAALNVLRVHSGPLQQSSARKTRRTNSSARRLPCAEDAARRFT